METHADMCFCRHWRPKASLWVKGRCQQYCSVQKASPSGSCCSSASRLWHQLLPLHPCPCTASLHHFLPLPSKTLKMLSARYGLTAPPKKWTLVWSGARFIATENLVSHWLGTAKCFSFFNYLLQPKEWDLK